MMEANQRMNLTRITEADDFFVKHLWDSFTLLPYLPVAPAQIVDVGTGGGVPGVPLWLLRPDLTYLLVDSVAKKLRAIEAICLSLQQAFPQALQHLPQTLHLRAETAGQDKAHREVYDFVVSRAVAPLPVLLELCLPLLRRGGRFVAMKGPHYEHETIGLNQIAGLLGGRLAEIVQPVLPGDQQRSLLIFEKRSLTPKTLPRSAGVPQKNPLTEYLQQTR